LKEHCSWIDSQRERFKRERYIQGTERKTKHCSWIESHRFRDKYLSTLKTLFDKVLELRTYVWIENIVPEWYENIRSEKPCKYIVVSMFSILERNSKKRKVKLSREKLNWEEKLNWVILTKVKLSLWKLNWVYWS